MITPAALPRLLLVPLITGALLGGKDAQASTSPQPPKVAVAQDRSALKADWQHGAFMEIFVRGFQDSDGDGHGDLRGLIQRLDYLQDLGVTGIWLMPIMPSADHDHGYATTDYRGIEPQYGSLADFDELLRQAHKRGIGVIIDDVINHSAAEHPFFQQALNDRHSLFRDWYVWQDTAPAGWDVLGKNPWTPTPNGAYYATFGQQMPDFNMRNPMVVNYHLDSMRFWLDRGLDGFRLDAVPHLIENDATHWNDQPESRQLTRKFQQLIKSYPHRYTVCEATAAPLAYAAPDVCGSAFAFSLQYEVIKAARGDVAAVQKVSEYFKSAPAEMATMLANHDIFAGRRIWDQLQDLPQTQERYKVAAATYLLQPGIPFIYYGEEIGMAGALGLEGDGPLRAPMSWTANPAKAGSIGFSTSAQPFRPMAPNIATHNVETEAADPDSLLNFYKAMLHLRAAHPALRTGRYAAATTTGQLMQFERQLPGHPAAHHGERLLIAINYGTEAAALTLSPNPKRKYWQQIYPALPAVELGAAKGSPKEHKEQIPALAVRVYQAMP